MLNPLLHQGKNLTSPKTKQLNNYRDLGVFTINMSRKYRDLQVFTVIMSKKYIYRSPSFHF